MYFLKSHYIALVLLQRFPFAVFEDPNSSSVLQSAAEAGALISHLQHHLKSLFPFVQALQEHGLLSGA